MIRTAYPLPFFQRAQLRLERATRRSRRTAQAHRHVAAPVSAEAAPVFDTKAESATRADEKAIMNAFYNRYDDLTGLICLAAQEGVTSVREARYQAARQWFMDCAGEVRPFLAPYLSNEAQGGDDPFACFWSPPTLADLLKSDDGDYIARMERTQNALAAWENAL